jgi:hypothetical protein
MNANLFFSALFFISFELVSYNSLGQKIKKEDYFFVDGLAQKAGPMKGFSLQFIVDSITKECKTELQMTRAFYYWQSHFLSFDAKRKRRNDFAENASTALMERKAASLGFAKMFKAMCDLKNIECKVVKGVIRYRPEDIGNFDKGEVHFWNIVSINNTNYLVDVTLGMGNFDAKGKHIVPQFTDAWWLTNRLLFSYVHFPEEPINQLIELPLTKKEFSNAPIVFSTAIVTGLIPGRSLKGVIKGKEFDSSTLKFSFASSLRVTGSELSYDGGQRISIPFDFDEFGFNITLANGDFGKHLLTLYFNNGKAFLFKLDIKKGFKQSR